MLSFGLLSRQRPMLRRRSCCFHIRFDLLDYSRMPDGDVALFTDVIFQVVKLDRPVRILGDILPNALPVAHPHRLPLALLVKFPVEKFMLSLLAGPAKQGRDHRNAVNALRRFYTDQLAAGRQETPERRDMITHRAGLYPVRPAGYHRHANAALVQGSLVALQRAGTVKELLVPPAFLMGTVVTGKYNQSIVVDSELFEFRHQPATVTIHSRYHGGMALLRLGPVPIPV